MRRTLVFLLVLILSASPVLAEPKLKVHDARVQVTVFAEHPEIVTPTGIAVAPNGDVFVVECHTHFPPPGYPGPKTDRIKLLRDTDGNGVADRITIFAYGTQKTMNVAVHPADGAVFVATRSEVWRMVDTTGDGRADKKQRLIFLKTKGNYPHNGISGFAFGHDGRVYFGLGENLGAAYSLIGSDRTLHGGGEGGNVYSCRVDGSDLKRQATGFWNPFHLCFDGFGNLFAVDNDPDSRPPCRLLHIVPGADFGYRFRNGRRGIHPFTAWDGELPGTLPMAAGTGEAPSGMTVYDSTMLPAIYRGRLLVTSWGEHRLETYSMKPHGGSFRGEMSPLLSGGENFRPVGVAVAPDGSIFLSDWVDRSYKLHSKGRIWRITAKQDGGKRQQGGVFSRNKWIREAAGRKAVQSGQFSNLHAVAHQSSDPLVRASAVAMLQHNPQQTLMDIATRDKDVRIRALAIRLGRLTDEQLIRFASSDQPGLVRAAALRRMTQRKFAKVLLLATGDADPFIRQAARAGIATAKLDVSSLLTSKSPWQRRSAALVLRERGQTSVIPSLLKDRSEAIQQIGIQWIGESRLVAHRSSVESTLSRASSRGLFESCLATLELLTSGTRKNSGNEWDGRQYAYNMLEQSSPSEQVQMQILRALGGDYAKLTVKRLQQMLGSARNPQLQLEIIKSLRECQTPKERNSLLVQIALSKTYSEQARAEALVGLQVRDKKEAGDIAALALALEDDIAFEALRVLRASRPLLDKTLLQELTQKGRKRSLYWRTLVQPVLSKKAKTVIPTEFKEVLKKFDQSFGNAQRGERIFFNKAIGRCAICHESRGRGGRIGPDLTQIGRTMSKQRLIESIVYPSREVAPRYVPWTVVREDGRTFSGMYLGHDNKDRHSYADTDGKIHLIPVREIARRQPLKKSIMPEGLAANLTWQEFRDVIAYLRASK